MEETVAISPGAMAVAAVVAAVLIPVVSIVKKPSWSTRAKYGVGMLAAIISAFAGLVIDGNVNEPREFLVAFTTAIATSQTIYNLYFRDTDINVQLENTGNA